MGLGSGKSAREKGEAVRIQPVSSRMLVAIPQLLLIMGNLRVRYLAGDETFFQHRWWLKVPHVPVRSNIIHTVFLVSPAVGNTEG